MSAGVCVRLAADGDLAAVTEIYNHYVRETAITFDVEPYTVGARREWFAQFGPRGRYRLLVAEEAGTVIGYAGTLRFRPKAAYDPSVEVTVYLLPGSTGRGLGARLYERLFAELRGEDVHRAYAGITLPNYASISLHRRFGFRSVGVMHQVGRKLGRFWDVGWFEKELG
jgi:phosphinothricin acetyltransferase